MRRVVKTQRPSAGKVSQRAAGCKPELVGIDVAKLPRIHWAPSLLKWPGGCLLHHNPLDVNAPGGWRAGACRLPVRGGGRQMEGVAMGPRGDRDRVGKQGSGSAGAGEVEGGEDGVGAQGPGHPPQTVADG